jgi:hypothetical protein
MAVRGVSGILMSLWGWGYGRILGGVGRSFLVISDLKWERASMFDYDMICGMGI